ncbi:hypothetical protein ACMDCR_25815 [Labrys okinawensis]|uniref:hypothetical protein n=1 Tax=Labrys okinawensis TaxID=346911 RepID=UPI0039BD245F
MGNDHDQPEPIIPPFNPEASAMLVGARKLGSSTPAGKPLLDALDHYELTFQSYFREPALVTAEELVLAFNTMAQIADDLTGEPSCRATVEFFERLREEILAMFRPMESGAVH